MEFYVLVCWKSVMQGIGFMDFTFHGVSNKKCNLKFQFSLFINGMPPGFPNVPGQCMDAHDPSTMQ